MRMELNEFLSLLEARELPLDPARLADLTEQVAPGDRKVALARLLEWHFRVAMAFGARSALHLSVPVAVSSVAPGGADALHALLFPKGSWFGPDDNHPWRFQDWQRHEANSVNWGLRPGQRVARQLWLERCRKIPEWTKAIASIAGLAETVRGFNVEPTIADDFRFAMARSGEPDCEHVVGTGHCSPRCSDKRGREAHYGWAFARAPSRRVTAQPTDCSCCRRDHNWTPQGKPRCRFCAVTLMESSVEVVSRQWGGWLWLRQALRDEAYGTEPERAGPYPLGVLYVPVCLRAEDVRRDAKARLGKTFDKLWADSHFPKAKNRRETTARRKELEVYVAWLWERRVEGDGLHAHEVRPDGGTKPDVDEKTRTRGINLALRLLH